MKLLLQFKSLFILGLISFLGVAYLVLFQANHEVLISISWIACLILHLFAYSRLEFGSDLQKVEELLTRIISVGVLVLLLNLMGPLAKGIIGKEMGTVAAVLDLLVVFSSLNFLLYSLFLYRKLHVKQEQSEVYEQWDRWLVLLGASAILHLPFWPYPRIFSGLILAAGLIWSFYFVFRVKWIALVNRNGKLLSMVYLLVISLIFIGLVQSLSHLSITSLFPKEWSRSIFFILPLGFLLLYNLFAILTLVFNMPLSSIQEQRSNEILSFHALHKSVIQNEDPADTCRLLFSICYEETRADAAFMMRAPGRAQEAVFYSGGFKREQIAELLQDKTIATHKTDATQDGSTYYQDLYQDPFQGKSNFPYRSLLVVPLVLKGELELVLFLLKNYSDGFDQYNVQLAESFVEQTRLVLEKDLLSKNSIKADRARQELEIARNVQRSLMPSKFPSSDFYEMSAYADSLQEVGGDYYDFIELDKKRLGVIIADVSGSGASAAFYMAQLKGVFHALIQLNLPVDSFLEMANNVLANSLDSNMFVTATYAEFDFEKNIVHYGRAGHTPLIYYSAQLDETICIEDEGLGLGIIRDASYRNYISTYEIDLSSGDICILFTDGISEGRGPNSDEMFGHERIQILINENTDASPNELQEIILDDYYDFVGLDNKVDDHSVVVIKIK